MRANLIIGFVYVALLVAAASALATIDWKRGLACAPFVLIEAGAFLMQLWRA